MRAAARRAAPRARSGAHRRPNLPGEKVFLPLHLDNQKKTRTAACKGMHLRSQFRCHVRRPEARLPTCRAAVTWGWLGALLLLGLLLLGSWGEQPGGVRWDGVHALPPVGAVVLRHSSVSGTFAGGRNALARECLGGDMLSAT
jgi:hypothetical protein